MAKLITKFKYLKPSDKRSPGGYAKYIATREGVEKIDDSQRFAPETKRQRQFIQKIISDFPESTSILEYEDYLNKPTRENASEFISRAIEDHADEIMTSKTYADYIATRPRANRFTRSLYRRRRSSKPGKGLEGIESAQRKRLDSNHLPSS